MSKRRKSVLWVVVALLLLAGFYLLLFAETDYDKQTGRYYLKLKDAAKEQDRARKRQALYDLATEVGAGTEHTVLGTPYKRDEHTTVLPQTVISESELFNNIHVALQTRGALSARRQGVMSFVTFLVALSAAGASAWAAYTAWRFGKDMSAMEQSRERDRREAAQSAGLVTTLEHLRQPGCYALHVENNGASEARNIEITLNGRPLSKFPKIYPDPEANYTIGPGSTLDFRWKTSAELSPPFAAKIKWSDDSGKPGLYKTTLVHPAKSK